MRTFAFHWNPFFSGEKRFYPLAQKRLPAEAKFERRQTNRFAAIGEPAHSSTVESDENRKNNPYLFDLDQNGLLSSRGSLRPDT